MILGGRGWDHRRNEKEMPGTIREVNDVRDHDLTWKIRGRKDFNFINHTLSYHYALQIYFNVYSLNPLVSYVVVKEPANEKACSTERRKIKAVLSIV